MINTLKEMKEYIKQDIHNTGLHKVNWLVRFIDGRSRLYKALRRTEYYLNVYGNKSLRYKIAVTYYLWLCSKHHIQIPPNTVGRGLTIVHMGSIIINGKCKKGNNLRIHPGVVIGSAFVHEKAGAPIIGDNCYIGPGAKLFGPIQIGDNVAIGANAFVNKTFKDGVSIAGVPAKIVSNNGSYRYVKPFLD